MADVERYLQPLEVISFFASHEKSTNHDLIKEFRPLLIPENPFGKENHAYLKKLTASLVTVKKIQGQFSEGSGTRNLGFEFCKCLEKMAQWVHSGTEN